MQPKGRPQASFTVLASGITARVNDVMRGNGTAAMMTNDDECICDAAANAVFHVSLLLQAALLPSRSRRQAVELLAIGNRRMTCEPLWWMKGPVGKGFRIGGDKFSKCNSSI
jgi:hypothetical protein